MTRWCCRFGRLTEGLAAQEDRRPRRRHHVTCGQADPVSLMSGFRALHVASEVAPLAARVVHRSLTIDAARPLAPLAIGAPGWAVARCCASAFVNGFVNETLRNRRYRAERHNASETIYPL
jgi:hypothetical protein